MGAKIVILEGPRCSGKTTISKLLEDTEGFTRLKFERDSDPPVSMEAEISKAMKNGGRYVLDRFHLTELVYRTYDGGVPFPKLIKSTLALSQMLNVIKAKTYVLWAPTHVLIERTMEEERAIDIDPILSKYLWYMASAFDGIVTVQNVEEGDIERIVIRIKTDLGISIL
jgi:thymidylate kinase